MSQKAPKIPFTPEGLQRVADSVVAASEVGQVLMDGLTKRVEALEGQQEAR